MANSLRQLTCPRGHAWKLAPDEDAEFVNCPYCGERVANTAPASSGKGLWALMQRTDETRNEPGTSKASSAEPIEQPAESAPTTSQPQGEPVATPRPRGLWAVMSGPAEVSADMSAEPPQSDASSDARTDIRPQFAEVPQAELGTVNLRPLAGWRQVDSESGTDLADRLAKDLPAELSASHPEPVIRSVPAPVIPTASLRDNADAEGDSADDEDGWGVEDPDGEARVAEFMTAAEPKVAAPPPRNPHCRRALITGSLALLFIPLHLAPWWWIKWPAGIVGLAAVMLGHQAWTSLRRNPATMQQRGIAVTAMFAGALCMLAGPLGLNSLGHRLRNMQSASRRDPTRNLNTIGQGLVAYHDQYDHFPAGGIVETTDEGAEVPLHGWMTELLPFIGHADLARQIDRSRPYDHQVNLPIMGRPVDTFLAPGVSHQPTPLGLATTHFAGVGGQRDEESGTVHLSIFDRNSKVRRVDVVDGLANTLVAGEINQNYPAWGDPENWRQLDSPLNENPFGFGNASGKGAHFLMADGSVRFIPNATSMDVLRKLATRDGREPEERKAAESAE